MQMIERDIAADVARFAADGGDAAIERLAELGDDERPMRRGRQKRRENIVPRGRDERVPAQSFRFGVILDQPHSDCLSLQQN
jgi:hypothetical protein